MSNTPASNNSDVNQSTPIASNQQEHIENPQQTNSNETVSQFQQTNINPDTMMEDASPWIPDNQDGLEPIHPSQLGPNTKPEVVVKYLRQ